MLILLVGASIGGAVKPPGGDAANVVDRFEAREAGGRVTFYRGGAPMESYAVEGTQLVGAVRASVAPGGDILWSHGYTSRREGAPAAQRIARRPATRETIFDPAHYANGGPRGDQDVGGVFVRVHEPRRRDDPAAVAAQGEGGGHVQYVFRVRFRVRFFFATVAAARKTRRPDRRSVCQQVTPEQDASFVVRHYETSPVQRPPRVGGARRLRFSFPCRAFRAVAGPHAGTLRAPERQRAAADGDERLACRREQKQWGSGHCHHDLRQRQPHGVSFNLHRYIAQGG